MVDKADIQSISPLSPQQQGMLLETLSSTESGLHIEQEPFAGEEGTAALFRVKSLVASQQTTGGGSFR